jgi:hypothetical protein
MSQNHFNRREFVGASIAAALSGAVLSNAKGAVGQAASSTSVDASAKVKVPRHFKHFNFDVSYTNDETKQLLLGSSRIESSAAAPAAPRIGLPFWWDKDAQMLVNPYNVKYDPTITAGDYSVTATIENFRASQAELGDVWNKLTNNAQLRFTAGSTSAEDDPLKWILITGIDVADKVFARGDKQLAPLNQNNTPTEQLRPAEQVTIKKGLCTLQLNIAAQKKHSFWDTLLSVVKKFENSSVFGLLPIPKIYLDTATAVTTAFDQLTSQSKLLPVLTGKSYEFRIYDGSPTADLKFRPGHWVILDSDFAAKNMDTNSNLPNIKLDIPGLLYQLKDKNNQPVDTTYSVTNVLLNQAQASNGVSTKPSS